MNTRGTERVGAQIRVVRLHRGFSSVTATIFAKQKPIDAESRGSDGYSVVVRKEHR
jgi:hypothetical protein